MLTFVFALWIVTSSYTEKLAVYPSLEMCNLISGAMLNGLRKPPRVALVAFACVPVPVQMSVPSEEPKLSM